MKLIFSVLQIVISSLLIAAILIQAKGVGLGSSWGGGGELYRSKRGVEKVLFWLTILLVSLFLLSSIANILIK